MEYTVSAESSYFHFACSVQILRELLRAENAVSGVCRECGEFSFSLHMFSSDFGRMPRAENAVSEVCREWRMSLSNKSFSRNAIFLIFVMML